MKLAGYLLLLSAALHILGLALTGFSSHALFLIVPSVLYVVLFLALRRNVWGVRWLTLLVLLGATAAAVAEVFGTTGIPPEVFLAIIAANLSAALLLFWAIWAKPRSAIT